MDDLLPVNDRGKPVPPLVQVQITLNHFSGANFQRVTGLMHGVSQSTARACIIRVTNALVARKAQYIFMPTIEEMTETATEMEDRFHLPGFALGVDGCQVRYSDGPRGIPRIHVMQQYFCRKQHYSINVQVIIIL